ncbi:MAG: hypothetical protein DMF56_19400 [Acidobacteria bacterium]|nr:MAG: hypothetical protein DMF56_19400 [Acidobacteriota bacterium]
MNLDPLLQASLPQTLVSDKPVGPTMIIGLGGTGKEVLLRLRRKIIERYGALSRLPFLRFMHVDTDKTLNATEQYDLRGGDDPLIREIQFSNAERVDLTITGGTGKYVDHLNNYPSVKRWFPGGSKIAHLGDLKDGAGQVRIASRLGFFDAFNHQKITGRLAQCRRELSETSIPSESSALGFDFNAQNSRVVIVASIAGGTGSGTFLDMGYLVRRYFPEAERIGILLLPGFFSGYPGAERVRANGYAALMELNHYTFRHTFIADWTATQSERMGPPPFSSTYLIDNKNEAGLAIGSGGKDQKELDAYRMVAEVLYQDYSVGAFASHKRAIRVNLEQFNLNVYRHNFLNEALLRNDAETHKGIVGDAYPCRFGSFGLATIAFPTERVQSACASRLASKILDYWQKTAVDDPIEYLFTKFLTDQRVLCAQGTYERRDGAGVVDQNDIEDALMVYDAGSGRTFRDFLWEKAQALRVELESTPNGKKAERLRERRAELDQFYTAEDSEYPDEWGVGIRHLDQNMRSYLQRVKDGIEAKAGELANHPQYGVSYTLKLLQTFKTLLRNETFRYMQHFDDQVPVWVERMQYYSNALDEMQRDVARHEEEFLFRPADLKRDYEKLVGDGKDDDDRGAFFDHFYARAGKQVAKRGKWVCEQLEAFLGPDHEGGAGLLGRYHDLVAGFARLKDHLQKKEAYYTKQEASDLTLSLYRDGDVDEWYRTWIGEGAAEVQNLKNIGGQMLSEVFEVDGVSAALEKIQRTPVETVEEMMFAKCRAVVVHHNRQPDALTMLFDANRIDTRQRIDMVRQAYRLAKVWVAPSERGLEHTGLPPVSIDQRPVLIGFDDAANPQRVSDFVKLVEGAQNTGDSPLTFKNIGQQHRGMIVFYHELAGVPAFYPSSVTDAHGLRAAYNAFPEKEELHTDKNRFQFGDLIPKDDNEARQYTDSLRAFVLGRVLGIVEANQSPSDGDQLVYRYSYKLVKDLDVQEIPLGGEAHAVDYLWRDKRAEHLTHRRYLLEKIEKTIQVLRDQKKLAVYRLLLDFYMKKVYPPVDRLESGIPDLTMTQYSPEYAVLDGAKDRLTQIIGDHEQFQQQFRGIAQKNLEDPLTYEEYAKALEPYCKTAGKYADDPALVVVHRGVEWRDVFALDINKADKSAAKAKEQMPPPRPASPAVPADRPFGERPCPNCAKPIDQRAIRCAHCQKTIAVHVACPHCQEPRVPSDLEHCFKCGQRMRQDEPVDCPQCFNFSGYEEQFPCPQCGYDLKTGSTAPPSIGTPILNVRTAAEEGGGNGKAGPSVSVAEPAIATIPLVQCTVCYEKVVPGPTCSECSSPLEVR